MGVHACISCSPSQVLILSTYNSRTWKELSMKGLNLLSLSKTILRRKILRGESNNKGEDIAERKTGLAFLQHHNIWKYQTIKKCYY